MLRMRQRTLDVREKRNDPYRYVSTSGEKEVGLPVWVPKADCTRTGMNRPGSEAYRQIHGVGSEGHKNLSRRKRAEEAVG